MTSCVNEVSNSGKIPEISPLTRMGKAVFSFKLEEIRENHWVIEESGLFLAQSKEKQEKVLVFKDLQPWERHGSCSSLRREEKAQHCLKITRLLDPREQERVSCIHAYIPRSSHHACHVEGIRGRFTIRQINLKHQGPFHWQPKMHFYTYLCICNFIFFFITGSPNLWTSSPTQPASVTL